MNFILKLWNSLFNKPKPRSGPERVALCIGINKYPNKENWLKGCVNDAKRWVDILKRIFQFDRITMLLDNKSNKPAVVAHMESMIEASSPGDHLVITFSGHGTSVPDGDGDEPDGRDEALCLYGALLTDDEIRTILSKAKSGVRLTVIIDSCHSGTVTRGFVEGLGKRDRVIKYIPPEDDLFAENSRKVPVKSKAFSPHPEVEMNEVLITGCKSDEYSYDARLGGQPCGAMTYYATKALEQNPDITYNQWYKVLRNSLPSGNYPQSPQLEGRKENLSKRVFVV